MALYVSEHTKFIDEWLEKHPEEQDEQQTGRALWWDKPSRSLQEMGEAQAARVPNKAYYYDVN
jgi:hypothetical protein